MRGSMTGIVIDKNTKVPLFVILAAGIVIVPLIIWAAKSDVQIKKVPKLEQRQIEMYYDIKAIKKASGIQDEPVPRGLDSVDE